MVGAISVVNKLGGGNHLSVALALRRAGVDLKRVKFVAFKGSAESITALLGGPIDAVSAAVSAAVPYVRGAQLRAAAVSAPKRLGEPQYYSRRLAGLRKKPALRLFCSLTVQFK